MQNQELRRELSKISALADAIAGLAAHATHSDALEPAMAELTMLVRDSYEHLINLSVMTCAADRKIAVATRADIEDREDAESRRLAAP